MILIYTHTNSSRLQYVCEFIFQEQLGIAFEITTREERFTSAALPKINYSHKDFPGVFKIENVLLLFEKGVSPQQIECTISNSYKVFYNTPGSDFPFDIFAAVFYLLSRYEEYLPHDKDMYGRYAHENSLAFKEGFLNQPLINTWIKDFKHYLKTIFPTLQFKLLTFNFLPTYDIDIAWSYKNKGLARNIAGFIRNPSHERIKVLKDKKQDPFDSYLFLNDLHTQYKINPIYFFLVASSKGKFDKNISPVNTQMQQLIREHALQYTIGLHPSWKSNTITFLLGEEKNMLESIAKTSITQSRQHYIKFAVQTTPLQLIKAGIEQDFSMGYGSINGFRASVAASFYWYDITAEEKTALRIFPFCFMDANSFYEQQMNAEESLEELMQYYEKIKNTEGLMITIFHNNFLGEGQFSGWKEMYLKFITQVHLAGAHNSF